jgi:hypothetical protein
MRSGESIAPDRDWSFPRDWRHEWTASSETEHYHTHPRRDAELISGERGTAPFIESTPVPPEATIVMPLALRAAGLEACSRERKACCPAELFDFWTTVEARARARSADQEGNRAFTSLPVHGTETK